MNKNVK